jgi:phage FluMu protein Com
MQRGDLQEVRCPQCGKLLARGAAVEMQFKCTRCKTYFILRAERPNQACLERPPERVDVDSGQSVQWGRSV